VSGLESGLEVFTLPRPIGWLGARLPQWPPAAALAAALTLALGRLIEVEPLRPLCGKRLELRVIDAGLRLRLTFTGGAFVPVFDAQNADVVISATAYDFLLLARRKVDPDSLFFRRRLIMEGDTELGLLVKNTLDAIDFPTLWRTHHGSAGGDRSRRGRT
jgi:O2-independent ubiquinone biosynthesis accessory factor UbiT